MENCWIYRVRSPYEDMSLPPNYNKNMYNGFKESKISSETCGVVLITVISIIIAVLKLFVRTMFCILVTKLGHHNKPEVLWLLYKCIVDNLWWGNAVGTKSSARHWKRVSGAFLITASPRLLQFNLVWNYTYRYSI